MKVITSDVVQYVRADFGTLNGSNVSALTDLSGLGHHYSQGTGGSQPAYSATGGPNSTPVLVFDGSDDFLVNSTLDLPAPQTTNVTLWMVLGPSTWTNNDTFWSSPSTGFNAGISIMQQGVTPAVIMSNESTGPSVNLALGGAYAIECLFTGSASDAFRVNDAAPVMGNASTTNPTIGRILGARVAGAQAAHFGFAEGLILVRAGGFTAPERTGLAAYRLARYGF